ncbi:MAG: S-layer homology domain-containing protein [Candidatus Gracilibacteria bacterium]
MKRRIKSLFYASIGALSLVSLIFFTSQTQNVNVLQSSVLSTLKAINERITLEHPVDLSIEQITLKKIAAPTEDFNYFKYNVTLLVHNYGGTLVDGQLILSGGEGQKSSFVRNTDEGFTLRAGGTYIIENYEVVFSGDYNGGEVDFRLVLKDKPENVLANNKYVVPVFEKKAKINNIEIKNLDENGEFVLNFSVPEYAADYDFQVFTGMGEDVAGGDFQYESISVGDKYYEYGKFENDLKNIVSKDWYARTVSAESAKQIKFSEAPFADDVNHYLYVKAVADDENYLISDVLEFPMQEELTRAGFAKYFLDLADAKLMTKGELLYEDVKEDDFNTPYIKTLFNLGLLDPEKSMYRPEDKITREEMLPIVLHYFDVDLQTSAGAPHFEDVNEGEYLYNFAETLYATGPGEAFGEKFHPGMPATKNFVKYLVNAYK